MLARNYAKPFCIAGIILAEIYMLLVVLAPYGRGQKRGLLVEVPFHEAVPAWTPPPPSAVVTRVLVSAVFFGPFGGLVGLGVGLVFSAVVQAVRKDPQQPDRPAAAPPQPKDA